MIYYRTLKNSILKDFLGNLFVLSTTFEVGYLLKVPKLSSMYDFECAINFTVRLSMDLTLMKLTLQIQLNCTFSGLST